MLFKRNVAPKGEPERIEPYATAPNGAPFPLRSWPPDAAIDIQNLATWVDPFKTQGVPRFANIAARDAAIPAPVAGMMCYLTDTGTQQQHNGTIWVGDTGWTDMALQNGFVMDGSNPVYMPRVRMDCLGNVHTSGGVYRGTVAASGTVVATFPTRYYSALVTRINFTSVCEWGANNVSVLLEINQTSGIAVRSGHTAPSVMSLSHSWCLNHKDITA